MFWRDTEERKGVVLKQEKREPETNHRAFPRVGSSRHAGTAAAGLKARGRKVPAGCHRRQWARTLCKSGRCRTKAGTSPRRTGTDRDGGQSGARRHSCPCRLCRRHSLWMP
jgi:hypothetical protein